MKVNSIYIDHRNAEQVKWWNDTGSMLVDVVSYAQVVEAATNKPVGTIICLKGLLASLVIRKCNSFFKEPLSTMVIDT